MEKEKTVDINVRNIPEDLMEKFDIYVVKPSYPGGRSEAIRNLINAEVLKRQGKDKFVKKRHFTIPKSSFILFALPKHEWEKLSEWNRKKQPIEIAPAPGGEVFLLNNAELAKYATKKAQKIESTAP
jgi:hypothetical protein